MTQQAPYSRWIQWILANCLGLATGLYIGLNISWIASNIVTTRFSVLNWIIIGTIVGSAQWLALRQWASWANRWVIATIIAWGIGFLIVDKTFNVPFLQSLDFGIGFDLPSWSRRIDLIISHSYKLSIWAGGLLGLIIGFAQWLVLQLSTRQAGWWLPISTFSLALGFSIGNISHQLLIVGGVAGLVYGLITGIALLRILPLSKENT